MAVRPKLRAKWKITIIARSRGTRPTATIANGVPDVCGGKGDRGQIDDQPGSLEEP